MKQTKTISYRDKLTLTEKETVSYTGLGRNKVRELMQEIGAVRRVGRRVLYYRPAIDEYFEKSGQG